MMVEAIFGPHDGCQIETEDGTDQLILLATNPESTLPTDPQHPDDVPPISDAAVVIYDIKAHPKIGGAGAVYNPTYWPNR